MENQIPEYKSLNFVCFGGEDWWYHNRGHIDMQLMRRFARSGTVLYVNSIVMQKPSLKKGTAGGKSLWQKLHRKSKSILKGVKKVEDRFWVYSPFSLPLHHYKWGRVLNRLALDFQLSMIKRKLGLINPIIWVACPAACDVALGMKKEKLVYQRTDKYEEYPNIDSAIIKKYDQKLKSSADLTVYVNSNLFEEEKSQCRKAIYLDHGVDFELFGKDPEKDKAPADIRNIKRPIVGFFGGIDNHTLDLPFLEAVVQLLPEMSFVMIGNSSTDLSTITKHPNIRFLGQKQYEQIPAYGQCFDVCIMPWRQSKWIEACNPIKLKEYLALGKPVVSTPFHELLKYADVTYKAETPEEFAEKIRQSLLENNTGRILARREKIRKATWNSKAQVILDTLLDSAKPSGGNKQQ
jgi:glycosyltransferase involved in cell wall biosynthesis